MSKEPPIKKGHQHYNVGDLFITESEPIIYYLSEKKRYTKQGQFTFILVILKSEHANTTGHWRSFNTARLNDRLEYWGWKHVPVKK